MDSVATMADTVLNFYLISCQHFKIQGVHVNSGLLTLLENSVALATLGPLPGMWWLELQVQTGSWVLTTVSTPPYCPTHQLPGPAGI